MEEVKDKVRYCAMVLCGVVVGSDDHILSLFVVVVWDYDMIPCSQICNLFLAFLPLTVCIADCF